MNPETLTQFLAWKAPAREHILDGGILPAGQVMFIYGEYSTWKSWLAMDLAWAISTGTNWLAFGSKASKVLIVNSEITKDMYQERWESFVTWRQVQLNGHLMVDTDMELGLDTTTSAQHLRLWIEHHHIKVLILDNLYSSTFGDITKNTDANAFIRNCKLIANMGVALVIVHHSHQPIVDNTGKFVNLKGYNMFGSSFLTNWADTIMEVVNVDIPRYPDSIKITAQKHRLAKIAPLTTLWQFNRNQLRFDVL